MNKLKFVSFLILIVLGGNLLAQDTSLFRLSIHYQPNITGIIYNEDNSGGTYTQRFDDKAIFGSMSGIGMDYILSEKIALSIAIQYSRKGFQFSIFAEDYDTTVLRELTEMSDRPDWDYLAWEKTEFNCNYYFVGMPITLKYRLVNKNSYEINLNAGTVPYLFISRKDKVVEFFSDEINKNVSPKTLVKNSKRFYLSGIVGISFYKKINQSFGYFFYPQFEYLNMETITANPVNGHMYNFGMDVGVYYDF